MGGRATPTIANSSGRWPCSERLKMAGSSLCRVRSPDAPKITKTHGSARRFDMAAELRAQRRQDLFREGVIAARAEADVERRGEDVRGNRFLDCRVDGP